MTKVIAHRGASVDAPENSLRAIALAKDQGADLIEIDVRLTVDGVLVVHHDSDLTRSAGDPRRIDQLEFGELREISLNYPVDGVPTSASPEPTPTLEQALREAAPLPMVVEVKPPLSAPRELAEIVVRAIRTPTTYGHHAIISFDDLVVDEAAASLPAQNVGLIRRPDQGEDRWKDILSAPGDLAVLNQDLALPEVVEAIQDAGKELWIYSLDDEASLTRWVTRSLPGVISNTPQLARLVVDRLTPRST